MDDVSKLGPLWVAQLTKEVARHRNAATESLLLIDQDGDFAKQHLLLIGAANTMLAAPQLMTALRAGRVAIDVLMASLIEADPSFRPTQSPAWPALVAIKSALDAAEAP